MLIELYIYLLSEYQVYNNPIVIRFGIYFIEISIIRNILISPIIFNRFQTKSCGIFIILKKMNENIMDNK